MRFRTMVFGTFNGRHAMSRIELTPRGKKSEFRSSASSVLLWFVSSALCWVFFAPGGFGGVSRFYDAWYVWPPCLMVVTSFAWCDVVCCALFKMVS